MFSISVSIETYQLQDGRFGVEFNISDNYGYKLVSTPFYSNEYFQTDEEAKKYGNNLAISKISSMYPEGTEYRIE